MAKKKKDYGDYGRKQVSVSAETYADLLALRDELREEMHVPVSISGAASYAVKGALKRGDTK